ncbi:hypothetical protein ACT3CD_00530 [Geofilum sp. OHC36d9]|uniref:hypothetical protein n=1 Tax=Geofilum sp. OHC36d9 TaxID=3458413 RepID=UPI0040333923
MKQLVLTLMMMTGVVIFGTQIAVAQNSQQTKQQKETKVLNTDRPGYTDANADGICDNYDGQRAGKGLGPGNGEGKGRSTGKGLGQGSGLKDGSGRINGKGRGGNRTEKGNGQRLRDGSGPNCNAAVQQKK